MRSCDVPGCEEKYYASKKCKKHYRFPSSFNPQPIKRTGLKPKPFSAPQKKKKKSTAETIPELLARAQKVFNAWIRKRDAGTDGTTKCISCGIWKSTKEMDAGHFYPTRYSFLRFNTDNTNSECLSCNRMDDNHLDGYHVNLLEKIGPERFKWLADHRHDKVKWDRATLLTIIEKYKK
ncbi:recombination protein NinG [Sphingobacterium mizutaii]|uniref:recombination protein NinG n=1 Tax=Sphingobacterium mizutaii TaxID=1010 RepID=UPI0028A0F11D|nr:recombination protein NinG [Sphingobacterium mizutaii]